MSDFENKQRENKMKDILSESQKFLLKSKNKKISIIKKTKNKKNSAINIKKIPFGIKPNNKLNYYKSFGEEKELNISISSRNKNNITTIENTLNSKNHKLNNKKDFSFVLKNNLNKTKINKKMTHKNDIQNKSLNTNYNNSRTYITNYNNNIINFKNIKLENKNNKKLYLDDEESTNKRGGEIDIDSINSYSFGNNTNKDNEMLRPFSYDSKNIFNKNLITNNINNINFFISNGNIKEIYSNDLNKGKIITNNFEDLKNIKQNKNITSLHSIYNKISNVINSKDIIKDNQKHNISFNYKVNNNHKTTKNKLISKPIRIKKIKDNKSTIFKVSRSVSNYSIYFRKNKKSNNNYEKRNNSMNFRNRNKIILKEVESEPLFTTYNDNKKNKNINTNKYKNNNNKIKYKTGKENKYKHPHVITKQNSSNNCNIYPTSTTRRKHKNYINKKDIANNNYRNNLICKRKIQKIIKYKENAPLNINKNIKDNSINKIKKEKEKEKPNKICINKGNNEIELNTKLNDKNKEKENNKSLVKKVEIYKEIIYSPKSLSSSISLHSKKFVPKEYPNMALSSSKKTKFKKNEIKIEKKIKNIKSICKVGTSGQNQKKLNQDNFFIFQNFLNNPQYSFIGVCDGHGIFGQNISFYLKENLPKNIQKEFQDNNIKNLAESDINLLSEIINNTYQKTNKEMNEDERIDSTFSGSTCVSVIFTPERLFCINVGDSRCVLGKNNKNKQEWIAMNLSRDHKPCEANEKERIIKNGGKVESYIDDYGNFVGPERVWMKNGEGPGLAMSRSFGDEIAHKVGVIVNPEIFDYHFVEEDKFIIIASDGLWEFMSNEEVVDITKNYYLKNDIDGGLEYLYKEASRRWTRRENIIDDITIIIIFIE